MVPPDSKLTKLEDVDKAGTSIAVSARSAYDLWLERNIKNAELIRVEGIDGSFDIFMQKRLEALAGLRPRLITDVERVPGAKILDGQYTAVQQAMGCRRGKEKAASYLKEFVEKGVYVDAIFGTGLTRDIDNENLVSFIKMINDWRAEMVD